MNLLSSTTEGLAFAACAAGSAAAMLAEAGLRPQSQIFGRTLIAGRDPREVALTYDDGPNDRSTPALLDLLAEHEVRATFFMIGRFVKERPELARRVHAAGHIVGNHTYTHPWLAWKGARVVADELERCNRVLEDTLGAPVRYFRPPHGARNPAVGYVTRKLGLVTVQWNVMGDDWLPIGAEDIVERIQGDIHRAQRGGRGSNILLHDGFDKQMGYDRGASVAATRTLLEELPATGKRFVNIDAWG